MRTHEERLAAMKEMICKLISKYEGEIEYSKGIGKFVTGFGADVPELIEEDGKYLKERELLAPVPER